MDQEQGRSEPAPPAGLGMKVPPFPPAAHRPLSGSRWLCKAETGLWSFWGPVCLLCHAWPVTRRGPGCRMGTGVCPHSSTLKVKLETSGAVWLPATPSRGGSVGPSAALTQSHRQVLLSVYSPVYSPDFVGLAWEVSISVSKNCRAGLVVP